MKDNARMQSKLARIGIGISTIYTLAVVALRWQDFPDLRTMPLNEFGDFFAGVFGPIAILWLILGFLQQGQELKQNTDALNLQAEELKNSVEQHKELVKATREQVQAEIEAEKRRRKEASSSARPHFVLVYGGWNARNSKIQTYRVIFRVTENPARNLAIEIAPEIPNLSGETKFPAVQVNSEIQFEWVQEVECSPPNELKFTFKSKDKLGNSVTELFLLVWSEKAYKVEQILSDA